MELDVGSIYLVLTLPWGTRDRSSCCELEKEILVVCSTNIESVVVADYLLFDPAGYSNALPTAKAIPPRVSHPSITRFRKLSPAPGFAFRSERGGRLDYKGE